MLQHRDRLVPEMLVFPIERERRRGNDADLVNRRIADAVPREFPQTERLVLCGGHDPGGAALLLELAGLVLLQNVHDVLTRTLVAEHFTLQVPFHQQNWRAVVAEQEESELRNGGGACEALSLRARHRKTRSTVARSVCVLPIGTDTRAIWGRDVCAVCH